MRRPADFLTPYSEEKFQKVKEMRRAKLIANLEKQLMLIEGLISGTPVVFMRNSWRTTKSGKRVCKKVPARNLNWFWIGNDGAYFSPRYNGRVFDIGGGRETFHVKRRGHLPPLIRKMIEEVREGKYDDALEEVAYKWRSRGYKV